MFAASIPLGLLFEELPGGKAVEKLPALREFLPSLGHLLRDDLPFRAYIIARMFTSLFTMAAPFYIGYATVQLGLSNDVAVPVLLAMQTIGSLTGALAYTWLGARNNLLSIQLALGGAALLPICALLANVAGPLPLYFGFLVSGLSTSNLVRRLSTLDCELRQPRPAPDLRRLISTLIALISLIAPLIGGSIAQYFGYEPLFVAALIMTFAALFVTLRYMRTPQLEPVPA